jgi:predicted metal-binding protein
MPENPKKHSARWPQCEFYGKTGVECPPKQKNVQRKIRLLKEAQSTALLTCVMFFWDATAVTLTTSPYWMIYRQDNGTLKSW